LVIEIATSNFSLPSRHRSLIFNESGCDVLNFLAFDGKYSWMITFFACSIVHWVLGKETSLVDK